MQQQEAEALRGKIIDIKPDKATIQLDNGRHVTAEFKQHGEGIGEAKIGDPVTLRTSSDGKGLEVVVSKNEARLRIILDALNVAGLKPTADNIKLVQTLINNNMPINAKMIQKLNQAVKLSGSEEKAIFMLKNDIAVTGSDVKKIDGYLSKETNLKHQLKNLVDAVSSLKNPELRQNLLNALASDKTQAAFNHTNATANSIAAQNQAVSQGQAVLRGQAVLQGQAATISSNAFVGQSTSGTDNIAVATTTQASTAPATNTSQAVLTQAASLHAAQELSGQQAPNNATVNTAQYSSNESVSQNTTAHQQTNILTAIKSGEFDALFQTSSSSPEVKFMSQGMQKFFDILNNVSGDTAKTPQQKFDAAAEIFMKLPETKSVFGDNKTVAEFKVIFDAAQRSIASDKQSLQNTALDKAAAHSTTHDSQTDRQSEKNLNDISFSPRDAHARLSILNISQQEVNGFFRSALEKISAVFDLLRGDTSPESSEVLRSASNASENINFLNSLKSDIYLQLPLMNSNAELFVFKDKTARSNKNDVQSALIALDTLSLGHFEAYIQKLEKNVNIQFRLDSTEIENIVKNNISKLKYLLSGKGYNISDISFMSKGDKFTFLDTEPAMQMVEPQDKRIAFDIRT